MLTVWGDDLTTDKKDGISEEQSALNYGTHVEQA